jgi:hypothetical protein
MDFTRALVEGVERAEADEGFPKKMMWRRPGRTWERYVVHSKAQLESFEKRVISEGAEMNEMPPDYDDAGEQDAMDQAPPAPDEMPPEAPVESDPQTTAVASVVHDAHADAVAAIIAKGTPNEDGSVTISAEQVAAASGGEGAPFEALPPEEQAADIAVATELVSIVNGEEVPPDDEFEPEPDETMPEPDETMPDQLPPDQPPLQGGMESYTLEQVAKLSTRVADILHERGVKSVKKSWLVKNGVLKG